MMTKTNKLLIVSVFASLVACGGSSSSTSDRPPIEQEGPKAMATAAATDDAGEPAMPVPTPQPGAEPMPEAGASPPPPVADSSAPASDAGTRDDAAEPAEAAADDAGQDPATVTAKFTCTGLFSGGMFSYLVSEDSTGNSQVTAYIQFGCNTTTYEPTNGSNGIDARITCGSASFGLQSGSVVVSTDMGASWSVAGSCNQTSS
jgi:hypothetical protein